MASSTIGNTKQLTHSAASSGESSGALQQTASSMEVSLSDIRAHAHRFLMMSRTNVGTSFIQAALRRFPDEALALVRQHLAPHLRSLALDEHASYTVRGMLELDRDLLHDFIDTTAQDDDYWFSLCSDSLHTRRLAAFIMANADDTRRTVLHLFVMRRFDALCRSKHGCLVLQKAMAELPPDLLRVCEDVCISTLPSLCKDANGHYMMSYLVEHGNVGANLARISSMLRDPETVVALATDKFGSSCLERTLRARPDHIGTALAHALTAVDDDVLCRVANSDFGNYIVQALMTSLPPSASSTPDGIGERLRRLSGDGKLVYGPKFFRRQGQQQQQQQPHHHLQRGGTAHPPQHHPHHARSLGHSFGPPPALSTTSATSDQPLNSSSAASAAKRGSSAVAGAEPITDPSSAPQCGPPAPSHATTPWPNPGAPPTLFNALARGAANVRDGAGAAWPPPPHHGHLHHHVIPATARPPPPTSLASLDPFGSSSAAGSVPLQQQPAAPTPLWMTAQVPHHFGAPSPPPHQQQHHHHHQLPHLQHHQPPHHHHHQLPHLQHHQLPHLQHHLHTQHLQYQHPQTSLWTSMYVPMMTPTGPVMVLVPVISSSSSPSTPSFLAAALPQHGGPATSSSPAGPAIGGASPPDGSTTAFSAPQPPPAGVFAQPPNVAVLRPSAYHAQD